MLLDFATFSSMHLQHFKGGEKEVSAKMFHDDLNRIMYARLEPGASIGLHRHIDNSEIVYALQGEAVVTCDGKTEILKAGQCHYCPKGHEHGMKNESAQDFVCFNVVPQQ